MTTRPRYLEPAVESALSRKMVFIGGPRQVGKTTLALALIGKRANETHPAYLNWDDPRVAARLRKLELPPNEPLVILDEIHKYARWRNLVKGLYDTERSRRRIVVTGSARLDYYRKGGDSLANRYRYFRLHPFSLREIGRSASKADLESLLRFGGFPEPLFTQDEREHRIWQRDRISRVVRDDLRDLEQVREISLLDHLVELLPARVGSALSIKSLSEGLQVDHKTVDRWITILDNLYLSFRIAPFGPPKVRAVRKSQKLYLWDWSMTPEGGARFENLVASQLLKHCHFIEDTEGHAMELRYLRDTDKREVDFVVLQNRKPLFAVECKTGERDVSPAIRYFAQRTSIPRYYQVHLGERHFESGAATVIPFRTFCRELEMI